MPKMRPMKRNKPLREQIEEEQWEDTCSENEEDCNDDRMGIKNYKTGATKDYLEQLGMLRDEMEQLQKRVEAINVKVNMIFRRKPSFKSNYYSSQTSRWGRKWPTYRQRYYN